MARAGREVAAGALDLAEYIRPNDQIIWQQGSTEPLTLIDTLIAQRAKLERVRLFLTISFSRQLMPEHADHLTFEGIGGLSSHAELARNGGLDVHPIHFSQMCRDIRAGTIRPDVCFVHLAGPPRNGVYSFGCDHAYVADAARHARVVIAEVNEDLPYLPGEGGMRLDEVDVFIRTKRPMAEMALAVPDATDHAIAKHVLGYFEDGVTFQVGIGGVPSAILQGLKSGFRDLGLHTGMMSDPVLELMTSGVVTNARKPIDTGYGVCCALYGSRALYAGAPAVPTLRLRPGCYTHDAVVMSKLDRFVTINSAIEVDLGGQANAEYAGRYIGGVAGQVDYVRGARLAERGRSIIALRSRAPNGKPRIVTGLNGGIVTTARSDVDVIATEWGAAELAHKSLSARAKALIAIAHPDDREALERALKGTR